jgi:hypothetical protein
MVDLLSFVEILIVRIIEPLHLAIAVALGALAAVPKESRMQWGLVVGFAVAMTLAFEFIDSMLFAAPPVLPGDAMRMTTALIASLLQIALAAWFFRWLRNRFKAERT